MRREIAGPFGFHSGDEVQIYTFLLFNGQGVDAGQPEFMKQPLGLAGRNMAVGNMEASTEAFYGFNQKVNCQSLKN